jgi:Lsr2
MPTLLRSDHFVALLGVFNATDNTPWNGAVKVFGQSSRTLIYSNTNSPPMAARDAVDEQIYGVGGTEYEIDLNEKNAKEFRKQLAPFIEHARRAGRAPRRAPGRTASSRQRSGRHQGLGQGPRDRGQRAWAHPRHRG